MKDLRILFNGGDDTRIMFDASVDGKSCIEQQVLVNLVTEQGSDPLYEDRGTTLLEDSINGLAYDTNEAKHVANFASIDTLFFINAQHARLRDSLQAAEDALEDEDTEAEEDEEDDEASEVTLSDVDIDLINYSADKGAMELSVAIKFSDDTSTNPVAAVDVTL